MTRRYNAKPPVKPIGRILYSERYRKVWDPKMYEHGGYRCVGYQKVCECKGFSDDRPFAVYKYERELASNEKPPKKADPKPFKVTFHWTNENFKRKKVQRQGEWRDEIDSDTYHMTDILEEHATLSAAQKAMRRFATEAFAKVNEGKAAKEGDKCHNVCWNGNSEVPLHLGDLVEYVSCPGIVWRIVSERRTTHDWSLKVEPVFSFLVSDGTDKVKEISQRDVYNYVKPIDLVKMGAVYVQLGNVLKDEAKRLAK